MAVCYQSSEVTGEFFRDCDQFHPRPKFQCDQPQFKNCWEKIGEGKPENYTYTEKNASDAMLFFWHAVS